MTLWHLNAFHAQEGEDGHNAIDHIVKKYDKCVRYHGKSKVFALKLKQTVNSKDCPGCNSSTHFN